MKSNALKCLVQTCTLLCLVALSLGTSAQEKILLYDDCEATNKPILNSGGYPPKSWGMKQGDPSNPLVRSTEAARKGVASYKIQVNNNATSGYFYCKSELVWNFLPAGSPLGTVGNNTAYYYQPLNLRWVAASTMIPTYNNDFNTPTGIGFNTKCVEDDWGSGTTFALQMYQGRYRIMVAKVTKSGTAYSWGWANGGAIDMGPVVKGQWEDWVLNRNFTSDPTTGFIRFYKNGKLMFEHLGGNWYDDGKHSKEPYMQMGLYKWAFDGYSPAPDVNQVTMFMDEIRMGTDQASLNDFLLDAAQAPANQSPVANAGTAKSITLPTNSISLTGSGTDSDGTIASYSWSQTTGPNTATITNGKTATATFSNLIEGNYTFRLTVTDNAGATGSANVTVTVNPAPATNLPPTANAGSDKNITLPTNSTTLTGSGTDSDGTIASFNWVQLSGPGTSTIGSSNSANTSIGGLIQGAYTFRLTITDNSGATDTDDIIVTVNPEPVVNQAPVVNAGNNQSITLPTNTVSLSGSATDADGTISSYRWSQIAGPNTAVIATSNAAGSSVTGLIEGTYSFRLTATDNDGAVGQDDVTVTINTAVVPNQAPTANAGNNISVTLPTNSVTINGTGTDGDGTITAYRWSQISGPGTAIIGSVNAASSVFSGLISGTYTLRLTVTDNDGATDVDDVTVTVNAAVVPNQAPLANAGGNKSITLPTNSITLTGTGTDSDGTVFSYRWSQVSGPSASAIGSANSAGSQFSGLVQGIYTFRLTVTDNDGAADSDDVSVTVNAAIVPNQAPIANAGSNKSVTLPTNTVSIGGSATDADGTIATYRWSQVSGPGTATISSPNSASSGFSGLLEGNYTFRLTATDNDGAAGADDVLVTVNPAPVAPQKKAPVANAGGKKSVTGKSSKLDATASYDPDGQIVSFSWSQESGPNQASIVSAKSATTDINNLAPGTYTFKLTVTDNDALASTVSTTVLVSAAPLAPNANAGANITITLPVNTAVLNGAASSDPDGTIQAYKWSQVSGPNTAAMITTTSNSKANVTSLIAGNYLFKLEVTDNQGLKDTATVSVKVNPQPANKLPVIVTETAINIAYPTDTVLLNGSKSYDTDGTIKLYQWKLVNGPSSVVLTTQNTAVAKAANLLPGVYTFQLLIRDDRNGTVTQNVTVSITDPNNRSTVSMKVFPNPVSGSGTLNIRLDDNNMGNATLKIYSMSGVIIMQEVINKQSIHFMKSVNVSNFMSGTYVLHLQFDNQAPVTRKFQKL